MRTSNLLLTGSLLVSPTHAANVATPAEYPTVQAETSGGITPISDVNANTAQGLAILEFIQVTIEGVAQLASGVLDPFDQMTPSTWFYVADSTGGVAIAHAGKLNVLVTAGERIRVTCLVATQGISPIGGTRSSTCCLGAPQR